MNACVSRIVALTAVLWLLLAAGATAQAAEYYVDNSDPSANDSNPGTESQPWVNCPGMDGWSGSAVLQPGDVVYFNSGSTWELSSGSSVLQVAGGVTYDGSTWGDGTRATLRATGELGRSVINLMEDNASTPTVVRGFDVDAGSTVTTGIGVNWPQSDGSLTGAVKRIENCVVHDVDSRSAQGEYEYGIAVSSGYGGGRTVSNVEILNCTAYNISRGGINIYSANDDPLSRITDVLVRGCEIYATGLDPDYAGSALPMKNHVSNVIFEFNHVHNTTRGVGIGISSHDENFRGPENAVIRYNIIRECEQMGVLFNVKGDVSADVYGNLILGNVYQGIRFMDVQDNVSIRIFNNTLVHNHEPSWSHEILVYTGAANVSVLEVTNNLFVAHADTIPLQDDDGSITDHSNNLFFRTGGGALVRSGGTTYTSADIASWESSAITSDPLQNDISNLPTGFVGTFGVDLRPDTEGLNLAENSPARNGGAPLDAAYSGSINSVARPSGTGWDIGAYEYNEGGPDYDAGVPVDAQIPGDGGGDGATGNGGSGKSGCGCRAGSRHTGIPSGDLFLFVLIFGLMVALRRRRN